MRFTELASLANASEYFQQDEKFKRMRMPSDADCDFLVNQLEPEGASYGDEVIASYALSGYVFDADTNVVNRLMDALSTNWGARFAYSKKTTNLVSIGFHLPASVGRTCRHGLAPDIETIKSGLAEVVEFFEKNKRSISHVADIKNLVDAVFIAFLAHDLETVEKLLKTRNNSKNYPFMDALARDMFKHAKYETVKGRKIIRIHDTKVKEGFISLFDAHRDWTASLFTKSFPKEYCRFLGNSFLGSYCLMWIFAQTFAEKPVFCMSKREIRLILTDTQA